MAQRNVRVKRKKFLTWCDGVAILGFMNNNAVTGDTPMTKVYIELPGGFVMSTDEPELWPEGKKLPANEGKAWLVAYHKAQLLRHVAAGDTIYTVLRHVSASGMQRRIDLYAIKNNEPVFLSGYAASVLDRKHHDKGGIVCNGCGMDMGFEVVYNLSAALFGDGYAIKHRWL